MLRYMACLSVAALSLSLNLAPAYSQPSTQRYDPARCTNEKDERICRKPVEGTPINEARSVCVWTCTQQGSVAVCKGSGAQCNGKIPPGW